MRGENKKNTVMVADDDLFMRKMISTALRDLAQIIEVADGASVVDAYKTHMPDLVFMDIHLPNVPGTTLVEEIMKMDGQACIVMVSADSRAENVKFCTQAGARGFLTKPFEKKRVLHFFKTCPTVKFTDDSL